MKPDRHKQKRSAIYKKKHGMVPAKNEESDAADAKGQAPRKGQQAGRPPQEPQASKQGGERQINSKLKKDDAQKASEDEEDETLELELEHSGGAQFRRRQMTSNWHRYEIKEDVEKSDDLIDFEATLKRIGGGLGAESHFRFKDEQADEGSTIEAASSLTLDINGLGEALACIPLHERVGLDTSFFEPEEIKRFEATAAEYRAKYLGESVAAVASVAVKIEKPTAATPAWAEGKAAVPQITPLATAAPAPVAVAPKTQKEEEQENLEDWLDSVL